MHDSDNLRLPDDVQHSSFETRAQLLYRNWDVLHSVNTFSQIQTRLEQLDHGAHFLLAVLRSAYANTSPVTTLTFGETKSSFWQFLVGYGSFVDSISDVHLMVPLCVVTIEYFLVRTLGHWVHYLALHNMGLSDILDINPPNNIHCIPLFIHGTNFALRLSFADLQADTQCSFSTDDNRNYWHLIFPTSMCAGLALLRHADIFVTLHKSSAEVQCEICERWVHLLACMFLPVTAKINKMSVNQRIMALVQPNSATFDNAEHYESLTQQ